MAEPYVHAARTTAITALREWLAGEVPEDVLEPDLPTIDRTIISEKHRSAVAIWIRLND